jgi:hypothetical protein
MIKGRRRAISTSKIRKITAIRKNRREKGRREELFGSNPHSKGDLFSRSIIDFLDNKDAKIMTMEVIMIKTRPIVEIIKIICFGITKPFDWKSKILIY